MKVCSTLWAILLLLGIRYQPAAASFLRCDNNGDRTAAWIVNMKQGGVRSHRGAPLANLVSTFPITIHTALFSQLTNRYQHYHHRHYHHVVSNDDQQQQQDYEKVVTPTSPIQEQESTSPQLQPPPSPSPSPVPSHLSRYYFFGGLQQPSSVQPQCCTTAAASRKEQRRQENCRIFSCSVHRCQRRTTTTTTTRKRFASRAAVAAWLVGALIWRMTLGGISRFLFVPDVAEAAVAARNGSTTIFSDAPFMTSNAIATVATVATTAISSNKASSSIRGFLRFLLIFTAGGLFFSTAIAAVAGAYAVGMDNVQRLWQIIKIIVSNVWVTFVYGLQLTRLALLDMEWELGIRPQEKRDEQEQVQEQLEDQKKKKRILDLKWKSAWTVFKEQLGKTRQTAAQGVQALRQEARLYSAALGPPGLIPLQYVFDRLMPLCINTILRENLEKALAQFEPNHKSIRKMTLQQFTAGSQAPTFQAARIYNIENGMALDSFVSWQAKDLLANVQIYRTGGFLVPRIPVTLENVQLDGTIRVVLTPLTPTPPGFGAILLSFVRPPKISLDVKILGGEVTKLPFLRQEITAAIQKTISDRFLWPRRLVIPTMKEPPFRVKESQLSHRELADLQTTDPLLQAQEKLAQDPMLKSVYSSNATASLASSSSSTAPWAPRQKKFWLGRRKRRQDDDTKTMAGDDDNNNDTSSWKKQQSDGGGNSSNNNNNGSGFSISDDGNIRVSTTIGRGDDDNNNNNDNNKPGRTTQQRRQDSTSSHTVKDKPNPSCQHTYEKGLVWQCLGQRLARLGTKQSLSNNDP